MAASKLISRLLERASLSQKNRLALAAPAQNIFWSFAELEERVFDLATHLSGGGSKYLLAHGYNRWNDHGGGRKPRCVMRLDNVAENVLVQLACAIADISVCTVKTTEGIVNEIGALTVIHAAAKQSDLEAAGYFLQSSGEEIGSIDSVMLHLPSNHVRPLLSRSRAAEEFLEFAEGNQRNSSKNKQEECCAFYNSATGTSWTTLQKNGEAMIEHLDIGEEDIICVPITLCHAFGMSATLAALSSSCTLLLPSPTASAEHTVAALESNGGTVLLADTHTLKTLETSGFNAPPTLRGGFVKVGSGDIIGAGPPAQWCDVRLTTVGKQASNVTK